MQRRFYSWVFFGLGMERSWLEHGRISSHISFNQSKKCIHVFGVCIHEQKREREKKKIPDKIMKFISKIFWSYCKDFVDPLSINSVLWSREGSSRVGEKSIGLQRRFFCCCRKEEEEQTTLVVCRLELSLFLPRTTVFCDRTKQLFSITIILTVL